MNIIEHIERLIDAVIERQPTEVIQKLCAEAGVQYSDDSITVLNRILLELDNADL